MSDHSHGPAAAARRWGYAAEREQQRRGRAVRDLFPEVRPPAQLEDGDQRFTTAATDAWCRERAEVTAWDLDAAACDEAHLAARYFTKEDDGLSRPWDAERVWCNPPFSDLEPWLVKAWSEMVRSDGPAVVAMLLPASRTEQCWWQQHVELFRDGAADRNWKRMHTENDRRFSSLAPRLTTHFLPGRPRFGLPGNPRGHGVGSPPFGCVLLVWRTC